MLRSLSEHELDQLLRFARVQLFPRNRVIFEQGEPGNALMAVLRGSAKVGTPTRGGKEVILNILGPGEIFGEIALLDEGARSATVTTLEDTTLLIIENRNFKPILDANPDLCRSLLRLLCGRLRRASDQVVETMFLERAPRLAKTLMWLAERYGSETAEGIVIGVTLSQRELGNVAAMSRESVNKQLTEWKKLGLVSMKGKTITIANRSELQRVSELDTD